MKSYKIEKLVEFNKLKYRLESLVYRAPTIINTESTQIGKVRLKPFFRAYNICIKIFKSHFPEEFRKLEFEELPLQGKEGEDLFTLERMSTLISQSDELIAILKGILYPYENYLKVPGNITAKWLYDNANYKFFIKAFSIALALIGFGIIITETNLYKNIKPLFSDSSKKITSNTTSEINNTESPANKNGANTLFKKSDKH